jgi:hypothetical protein
MKVSAEGQDVFSDLLVEGAGFLLLSILGYVMAQDWLPLTSAIVFCILAIRFAIYLRKRSYDKSQ